MNQEKSLHKAITRYCACLLYSSMFTGYYLLFFNDVDRCADAIILLSNEQIMKIMQQYQQAYVDYFM